LQDPISIGHKSLREIEKKILSDWKLYLEDPTENIIEFAKRMNKKYTNIVFFDERQYRIVLN